MKRKLPERLCNTSQIVSTDCLFVDLQLNMLLRLERPLRKYLSESMFNCK